MEFPVWWMWLSRAGLSELQLIPYCLATLCCDDETLWLRLLNEQLCEDDMPLPPGRSMSLTPWPVPYMGETELPLLWPTAITLQGWPERSSGWKVIWLIRRSFMEDTAIILWLSGIKDGTTKEGKGTTEGGQDDDWPGRGPWEGKVYVGRADLEKDDCGAKASCGLDWYILKTGRHPRIDNNLGPGKMSEG